MRSMQRHVRGDENGRDIAIAHLPDRLDAHGPRTLGDGRDVDDLLPPLHHHIRADPGGCLVGEREDLIGVVERRELLSPVSGNTTSRRTLPIQVEVVGICASQPSSYSSMNG